MTDDNASSLPLGIRRLFRQDCLGHLRDALALDAFELELFDWYLRDTDLLIAQMETKELEYVQEQSAAGDPEPNDTGLLAPAYYSRRVRYSHVIYLASLLESIMKRECHRLIAALGEQNVPFLPSDLKGDPWTAKRKALEKYGHFEIPSVLWDPLQKLLDVRNLLVHDNGATESMHRDKRSALARIPGLRIESGELEISAEYVRAAFGAVRTIAKFLHDKVGPVIEQAIRPRQVVK